jgi:hypothetical protein
MLLGDYHETVNLEQVIGNDGVGKYVDNGKN